MPKISNILLTIPDNLQWRNTMMKSSMKLKIYEQDYLRFIHIANSKKVSPKLEFKIFNRAQLAMLINLFAIFDKLIIRNLNVWNES